MAKAGRPLKYDTPEKLERAIVAYFKKCDKGRKVKMLNRKGDVIAGILPIPYTIEGLAVHLGLSRQGILDYANLHSKQDGKERFLDIISQAKEKIASRLVEDSLLGVTNPVMAKLNLSANFGYADKSEVRVKTKKVKFNF